MLIVAALGGNALLRRGEMLTADVQRRNVRRACEALAKLVKAGHQLVVTHGNGPQVGLLALQGAAYRPEGADPLDVLGAETEGMIGYMIEQELENAIGHQQPVATLLTQVVVDPEDPAFQNPTKFVGPVYGQEEAERKADADGWVISKDGDKWRRVVASPFPLEIPDISVIRLLLNHEVIVICAGGGGIPVIQLKNGSLLGVEAVIDKDAVSALLAEQLHADALLLLTDVDGVYRDFGTPAAERLTILSSEDIDITSLPAGSMKPKVIAAGRFSSTGGIAGIGRLEDALDILQGKAGTSVIGK
tara:strand:+ start:4544 stop:5452 length:909 start_codon:yes stop_codon:yes gene_type:complete